MTPHNLAALGRQILSDNCYMTLATGSHSPWASPVYYRQDPQHNFYYMSQLTTRHSKNILASGKVAFAVFDSHQKPGTGTGVQGYGHAKLVSKAQAKQAQKWYPVGDWNVPNYHLFKITPIKFYVLDPDEKEDKRVEVKL